MTADRPPRLRARIKQSALALADRAAGRSGLVAPILPNLRPYLVWRPDARAATGLIPSIAHARDSRRDGPIFVTGRFRAGTTLVWNLFRNAGRTTAYYEPFNPRRWFDPVTRGDRVDPSHRGVTRYWDEYAGAVELAPLFRARWHDRNLFMAAEARDAAMERYVRALIERAPQRPVLQFNRIDFRLPWFRKRFPEATILHVLRNPRDQWCSMLLRPDLYPSSAGGERFSAHDHFYLRHWVERLAPIWPFLAVGYAAHPYRAHYMIWRLSQAFGLYYADESFNFEDLIEEPRVNLAKLAAAAGMRDAAFERMVEIIDAPRLGRWVEWADDDWFSAHEDEVEQLLAQLPDRSGGVPGS